MSFIGTEEGFYLRKNKFSTVKLRWGTFLHEESAGDSEENDNSSAITLGSRVKNQNLSFFSSISGFELTEKA